ncbi:MAG: wax ester/triacylglycerol synthase family O-acyltransferase [Candidatus Binatia bacterium]
MPAAAATAPHHERLSALDAAMVFMEAPNTHMHVGSVGIFEVGALGAGDGGVDIDRIRSHFAGVLDEVPRFRQRLEFTPIEKHPVWVDDASFNLGYHVHHARLPRPGTDRQLKRLAGRLMSQKLDLAKPPWEMWVVEGLEGGRFAVVSKMHHCMVDGIAAVHALSALFSADPTALDHLPSQWAPRPAPGRVALAAGELQRMACAPLGLLRAAATACADPARTAESFCHVAEGAVEVVQGKLRPASRTPLNPDAIGPHRRLDWVRFDLEAVIAVKRGLGAKLNDVVLALVTGALRRYLLAHRVPVGDLDFRVVVPVNTRPIFGGGMEGNRVVPMLARLPLEIADARGRVRHVAETMKALKASRQVEATEVFEDLSNWANAAALSAVVRRATRWWSGNMIVTNIPGPPFPLHLLGAPALECYPVIPLLANQAVSAAILSYAGGLHWGINSDWDAVPDLHALVECLADELAALEAVTVVERA